MSSFQLSLPVSKLRYRHFKTTIALYSEQGSLLGIYPFWYMLAMPVYESRKFDSSEEKSFCEESNSKFFTSRFLHVVSFNGRNMYRDNRRPSSFIPILNKASCIGMSINTLRLFPKLGFSGLASTSGKPARRNLLPQCRVFIEVAFLILPPCLPSSKCASKSLLAFAAAE